MFEKLINLQLFADAGTLVNATGNYVNAYSGETTAFDDTHTMAAEMKIFYDTELLENARKQEVYGQFAKEVPLPAKHGKTMEFRKANTFADAAKLTEGVIPTGQKFGYSAVTANIDQYGTYTTITDVLDLHAYDTVILDATEEMGASAASTQEALNVAALMTGGNVLYCDNVLDDGTFKSTPTSLATIQCDATAGFAVLSGDMVLAAVTKMRKDKVPTINGDYVAVIHPSVARDLMKDPDWRKPHDYTDPEKLYKGEIGKLYGVRFTENADAPVVSGAAGSKVAYATFFLGKDAFAKISPEGGNLEMIVKTKEQVGGPLNQFSTIGYKLETGAKILYPERVLRVMSTAKKYAGIDKPNT